MPQAAVEDADEPVRESAEGLVVGCAAVTLPVVERPAAGPALASWLPPPPRPRPRRRPAHLGHPPVRAKPDNPRRAVRVAG